MDTVYIYLLICVVKRVQKMPFSPLQWISQQQTSLFFGQHMSAFSVSVLTLTLSRVVIAAKTSRVEVARAQSEPLSLQRSL